MRINHIHSMGVNPYRRHIDKSAGDNKLAAKQDHVEISAEAKELQQHSQWLTERQQKVQRLKEQVQNGSYQIDASAVAKSVLDFYFQIND